MANKLTEEGEIMQNFTEKAKDVLKRAEDAAGALLGEGKHQRFVIDPERFMAKL